MSSLLRFLLASIVFGAVTLARAEAQSMASTPPRISNPIMAALDLDRDGVISARELAAAPVMLTSLDLDEDGVVSPGERATDLSGRVISSRRNASAFNLLLALDTNHDGELQSLEIAHAVSSLKQLDVNGDGQLTPNELRPARVARNRS